MSIIMDNLTVSYWGRLAVHYVSAGFADQSMWVVFGSNGMRKLTLPKAMMGLQEADIDRVRRIGLKRGDIAYLSQQSETGRSQPMTVLELAATGLQYEISFFGRVNAEQRQHAFDAFERIGTADFTERQIAHLSDGQFQHVPFTRVLVQDTKFLSLDGPFNAVDVKTTYTLPEVLAACHIGGRVAIAVLHDYEQMRVYFFDTLLLVHEKIAAGTTGAVLAEEHLRQADVTIQRHGSADWHEA